MKIALCFHGYLRHYQICYKQIIDGLGLNDHDYDIFIYTSKKNHIKYFDKKVVVVKNMELLINDIYECYGDKLKCIKFTEDDDEYFSIVKKKYIQLSEHYKHLLENKQLSEHYKHLLENEQLSEHYKHLLENEQLSLSDLNNKHNLDRINNYLNYNIDNYLNEHNFRSLPWILRQNDQFIRLYLCSQMMLQYSQQHQIKYDLVINLRPDILIVNANTNYLDKIHNHLIDNKLLCNPGIDYCFFSNITTNEKFSIGLYQSYGYIKSIDQLKKKGIFSPESASSIYVTTNFTIYKPGLQTYYFTQFKEKSHYYKRYQIIFDQIEELSKKYFGLDFLSLMVPVLNIVNFQKSPIRIFAF